MQLSAEQRAYQVRVNRAHGVRPPRDYVSEAERPAYVVWWARTLDARDARLRALTLERQARQDAALLPLPKGHVTRSRVDAVVMTMGTDAYPATVLLDRRVGVKVDPSTRRTIRGGKVGYEAVVTRPNGAHLHGKPVCKGQVLCVPLSMLDGPKVVAEATPQTARAKRNAAKKRAKRDGSKPPVKPATVPVKPKVTEVPPKVLKVLRAGSEGRADIERALITQALGYMNTHSK